MSDQPQQPGYILEHVLAFTHLLREMGVDVSPGQALELVRALEYAPITSREDFRGAARCTLIRRHEDLPLFDTAFAFYWRSGGTDPLSMLVPQIKVPAKPLRLRQRPRAQDGENEAGEEPEVEQQIEIQLSHRGGGARRPRVCGSSPGEGVRAGKALRRERAGRIGPRKPRRKRPTARGRQIDMRRLLRHNLRYG